MPKGPLGGPRPFAEYRILIDPHEAEIFLLKVGPLGVARPFAKDNPPISEDRVAECVISESGRKFGAGVVSDGQVSNISELPPPERKEALELAEKWCRGTLEATAMEELEEGQSTQILNTVQDQIDQMIRTGEEFEIEQLNR